MRIKLFGTAMVLLIVAATMAAAAVAGSSSSARSADSQISLVAYSTPREAYGKLIPMFQKTPQGDGVSFKQSYAASGEQTRAVKAGLEADIVALSLAPDVDELVTAGLVDAKWKKQSYKGMVTDSLVVFVVRDGNPKKIKGWNDLTPPRPRGHHAEPVHLGRRALEHHGRVWRVAEAGQDRQAGAGEPPEAVEERRRPGHERPRSAQHVQQRQGRRHARLRERGALRPHAGPEPAVRDPEADDPDREPDRGHEVERRRRSRRTPSCASCGLPRRSRSSPTTATGPC